MPAARRSYNGSYENEHLSQVAFPMGGMGAGMICLEGTGSFSHVSLHHKPEIFNEPLMFAVLHVNGASTTRVIEGPVPMRKAFGASNTGTGLGYRSYGLPRFAKASFTTRFPFGIVQLTDKTMPVTVELTGWSPFVPGDADNASLPAAGMEYRLRNRTNKSVAGVFSFHAWNFMRANDKAAGTVSPMKGGFLLGAPDTHSMSPYVASWQISRLFPIAGGIAEAPCARLADDLDWKNATMTRGYYANAYERFGAADGFVYIGTRVCVATAGHWVFSIGHDGGMRLFVDGRPTVAKAERESPHRPGRTEVVATMDAGEHEIMFAFELCGFGWGVSLSFGLPPDIVPQEKPEYPTPDQWGLQAAASTGGQFAAFTPSSGVRTDCAWFRGKWFDSLTMLWKNLTVGKIQTKAPFAEGKSSDGGSFYVPFKLKARAGQTIRVLLAWHVPQSGLCLGDGVMCNCKRGPKEPAAYVPWYATRFNDIHAVADYWRTHYDTLRARSKLFSDCFYDTTLPPEVVEAVAANLTILKSPTVLRQHDGRLWGWEGCCDTEGCCSGSCTHVWNYAQALCHLFPNLERTLRETEFLVNQDDRGHQTFRASLPIRPPAHNFHAAADGQLGGIMKVHREWRISGDTAWMKNLWSKVKQSLDYCIATWDPGHTGTLVKPHHNTYDIEFWGADGMCTSFYLGALAAAIRMGRENDADVILYEELLAKGKKAMETTLWNGEFFFQRIPWTGLWAADPATAQSAKINYTPEALALLKKEGPKYQYGNGCLSDGVIGDWLARCSGVSPVLDTAKTARHLRSVFAHNFRKDLSDHANPQRSGYAFGQEGGLLLCSWPRGGKLSLPFPYSEEVWTGIEYHVAAHLIMMGRMREGLRIVRTARDRYDGRYRNPFNEYECGHWYVRAMSSYSLLQALSGAHYDAVSKTLHLQPAMTGDFKAFLSTATGFGTVGVRNGKPFLKVVSGRIDVTRIEYRQ
ncbi:MAG: GH116 family glycosyl hydrolase [Kiritimatiellae bacterium]|nr:GH116 family glycosyl hydrolase [Kiritimatiellia bacterium]